MEDISNENIRWANSSTGDDDITTIGQTPDGFDDVLFLIRHHFDSAQIDAERETELG